MWAIAYDEGEMSKRRRRKNVTVNRTRSESPSSTLAPNSGAPPPTVVGAHHETKAPLTDAFKDTVNKAADRARSELISEGRIKPMVFFVHADGSMKRVSLSVGNEYQREVLIRRIREKVSAENVFAVVILTEIDDKHGVVLSGVTIDMRGSACINYGFDKTTKTIDSWKMTWLNQSVQNVFLDGIFDKTG